MGLVRGIDAVADLLAGSEREERAQRVRPFGPQTGGERFTSADMYQRYQDLNALMREAFELYRCMPRKGAYTLGEIRLMQVRYQEDHAQ